MNSIERVRVVVRVRPSGTRSRCVRVESSRNTILIGDEEKRERVFEFDGVLDEACDQNDFWEKTGSGLTKKVLEGYNATLMAYGQTGSGKTYSMGAPSDSIAFTSSATGRALSELFAGIHARKDTYFGVSISYLEIYNEALNDLLAIDSASQHLTILEEKGQLIVKHLSEHKVASLDDAIRLLRQGSLKRKVGSTKMNAESSRSHAMLWIKVIRTDGTVGKLNFVDLAGSERQAKTGATGERLEEGIEINKSLLVLGQVVSKLADNAANNTKNNHIPFRDSKLTRLLADSLGGTAKTVLLACVAPESEHRDETINSLRYASRARSLTNITVRHVISTNENQLIAHLREENERLRIALEKATARITSLQKQLVPQQYTAHNYQNFHEFEEDDTQLDEVVVKSEDEVIIEEDDHPVVGLQSESEVENDHETEAARLKYVQAVTTLEAEIAALEKARDEVSIELARKLKMTKSPQLKKEIDTLREQVRQRKRCLEAKSRELATARKERDQLRESMMRAKRERVGLEKRLREEASARAKSARAAQIAELRAVREQQRSKATLSKLLSEHELQKAVLRRKCLNESSLRRQHKIVNAQKPSLDPKRDHHNNTHFRFVDNNLNARLQANVVADVERSANDDTKNFAIRLPPLSAADARLALRWYHHELVAARRKTSTIIIHQKSKEVDDEDSDWEADDEEADDDDDDAEFEHARKKKIAQKAGIARISADGLDAMTIAELKIELKSNNLKVGGRKSELVERLRAHRTISSKSENVPACTKETFVHALYDCVPENEGELAFSKGSRIYVTSKERDPWWTGVLEDGTTGLFPSNYVTTAPSAISPPRQPLRVVNV